MNRWILTVAAVVTFSGAGAGHAQGVPDPARSTVPAYLVVVGRVNQGAQPDPLGVATVVHRDFANNPVVGSIITFDFSGCCDLAICDATANGAPAIIDGKRISGVTDADGRATFIVMGAAGDPGSLIPPSQYGGCGAGGVTVWADEGQGAYVLGTTTAASLDLNGAAGQSNGATISDVANVLTLFGAISLGAPYKGRGDINQDGATTIADVSRLLSHFGRLVLEGGVGCTSAYVGGVGCP